jgi:hypothetical protein
MRFCLPPRPCAVPPHDEGDSPQMTVTVVASGRTIRIDHAPNRGLPETLVDSVDRTEAGSVADKRDECPDG